MSEPSAVIGRVDFWLPQRFSQARSEVGPPRPEGAHQIREGSLATGAVGGAPRGSQSCGEWVCRHAGLRLVGEVQGFGVRGFLIWRE